MTSQSEWLVKSPIAHRGLHDNLEVPENSLLAFENTIKAGVPIELDVRVTKDKKVVVFHDDKLGRMTDFDGYLCSLTYEELSEIHLLKTTQAIPTLKQVLELVDGRVPLLIEIKNINGVNYENELWEVLKSYKGEYAIQSFSPLILEWFKINAPQVKRGILSSFFKGEKEVSFVVKFMLKRLKLMNKAEPNFISYCLSNLPNRYVKKYVGKLPVLAWTVNNNEEMEKAMAVADNFIFQCNYDLVKNRFN